MESLAAKVPYLAHGSSDWSGIRDGRCAVLLNFRARQRLTTSAVRIHHGTLKVIGSLGMELSQLVQHASNEEGLWKPSTELEANLAGTTRRRWAANLRPAVLPPGAGVVPTDDVNQSGRIMAAHRTNSANNRQE